MSMNAAELAALIAAVFWALLVCVGVFVLIRLGRLLSESSKLVADVRERGDVLLTRAQAAVDGAQQAVDRAGHQLDRAESVTASMDELGAGMSELAGQVTALAGLGRAIAGGPVGRAGALAYGLRHAVSLRRASRRTLPGQVMERGELSEKRGKTMIRRGFWLTAGAVTGIWGYRRVAAAGRRVSASLTPGGTLKLADTRAGTRMASRRARRGAVVLARETYRFTRDVREGMELYTARHPAPAGSTLSTDRTTPARPRRTT